MKCLFKIVQDLTRERDNCIVYHKSKEYLKASSYQDIVDTVHIKQRFTNKL